MSTKSVLAQKRNSAKWQLTGAKGQISNLLSNPHAPLTGAECEKLRSSLAAIDDILHWWNASNPEFGLNNPDLTKEKETK